MESVKTTTQIFYDKALFDNFQNADEVLNDFFSQGAEVI